MQTLLSKTIRALSLTTLSLALSAAAATTNYVSFSSLPASTVISNADGLAFYWKSNGIYYVKRIAWSDLSNQVLNVAQKVTTHATNADFASAVAGTNFDAQFSRNAATGTVANANQTLNLMNTPRFNLLAYGATNDGIVLLDAAVTAGSSTITSASANFQPADVGKVFSMQSAGTPQVNLFTNIVWGGVQTSYGETNGLIFTNWWQTNWHSFTAIITNVVDSHTVKVADVASHTVNATNAVYGTDNTPAIQAALNDIVTNHQACGTLFVPAGIYLINGPLQDTNTSGGSVGAWTNHHFAQIVIPPFAGRGSTAPTLAIEGVGKPATPFFTTDQWAAYGSMLWSTLPTSNPTNISRVWDTRNFQGYGGRGCDPSNPYYRSTTDLNPLALEFRKLAIRGTFDNGMMLIDADGADNFGIYDCVIDSGYNHGIAMPCPANTNTWGVWFPNSWANNFISCDNTMIRGFYNGANMTHHVDAYKLQIYECWNGVTMWNGGDHTVRLIALDMQSVTVAFQTGSGTCAVDIDADFTYENPGGGFWCQYPLLVNDPTLPAATADLCGTIKYDAQTAGWNNGAWPVLGYSTQFIEVTFHPLTGGGVYEGMPATVSTPKFVNGLVFSSDAHQTNNNNDQRIGLSYSTVGGNSLQMRTGSGPNFAGGGYCWLTFDGGLFPAHLGSSYPGQAYATIVDYGLFVSNQPYAPPIVGGGAIIWVDNSGNLKYTTTNGTKTITSAP